MSDQQLRPDTEWFKDIRTKYLLYAGSVRDPDTFNQIKELLKQALIKFDAWSVHYEIWIARDDYNKLTEEILALSNTGDGEKKFLARFKLLEIEHNDLKVKFTKLERRLTRLENADSMHDGTGWD